MGIQTTATITPKLPKIEIRKFSDIKAFTLYTENGERVGSIRYEWFAQEVVRRVNSHEELLAALKKIEKFAFKASGDEFLMWAQEAIAKAEVA